MKIVAKCFIGLLVYISPAGADCASDLTRVNEVLVMIEMRTGEMEAAMARGRSAMEKGDPVQRDQVNRFLRSKAAELIGVCEEASQLVDKIDAAPAHCGVTQVDLEKVRQNLQSSVHGANALLRALPN